MTLAEETSPNSSKETSVRVAKAPTRQPLSNSRSTRTVAPQSLKTLLSVSSNTGNFIPSRPAAVLTRITDSATLTPITAKGFSRIASINR